MKLTSLGQRTARVAMALGLLTSSLVATTASASQVRYRWDYSQPRYVQRSHSNVGPILGGFVGGILLGTLLANAAHGQVAAQYAYEDPYTERCYPSYDAYLDACQYEQHPAIVQVIDVRTGGCVRTERYDGGQWVATTWEGPEYDYGYAQPPVRYYGGYGYAQPRVRYYSGDRGYYDRGYGNGWSYDRGGWDRDDQRWSQRGRGWGDRDRDNGRRTWQREHRRGDDDDRRGRGRDHDDD